MHVLGRTRATAALAAVASAASLALAAAPAPAQVQVQIDPVVLRSPCLADPSLPTCVNWALDVAYATVESARDIYNEDVQPVIGPQECKVHYILTGERCPE